MSLAATTPPAASARSTGRRDLILLWIGQFVSQSGDAMFSTCAGFLVLLLLRGDTVLSDGAAVGLTRMMDAIPFLLFGAAAGVIADRFARRRVMLVSDLAQAAVVGAMPLLYFFGLLAWWMVPAAAFCLYTFSTVFGPARDALLPELASDGNLLRVNSFFQTSVQLAWIAGTAAAGLLLAPALLGEGDGLAWLLAIDAGTFLFSFVCVFFVRGGRLKPHDPESDGVSTLRRTLRSLAFAWRDRRLRGLLFLTAGSNFFVMGPAIVGALFLIRGTFGLGAAEYGWFEAAFGVGWFLGTLCIARFGARIATGRLVLAGIFLDGITYLPFLWIRSYPVLLLMIFLHALFVPLITVGRTTLIQRHYPKERLGRIFSLVAITVQGFTALSCLAAGAALEVLDPNQLFFAAGAGASLCGLIGLTFRSVRSAG